MNHFSDSQDSSVGPSVCWKDSFDLLIDNRKDLRAKNILKDKIRKSYNQNSSIEENEQKKTDKQIKVKPNKTRYELRSKNITNSTPIKPKQSKTSLQWNVSVIQNTTKNTESEYSLSKLTKKTIKKNMQRKARCSIKPESLLLSTNKILNKREILLSDSEPYMIDESPPIYSISGFNSSKPLKKSTKYATPTKRSQSHQLNKFQPTKQLNHSESLFSTYNEIDNSKPLKRSLVQSLRTNIYQSYESANISTQHDSLRNLSTKSDNLLLFKHRLRKKQQDDLLEYRRKEISYKLRSRTKLETSESTIPSVDNPYSIITIHDDTEINDSKTKSELPNFENSSSILNSETNQQHEFAVSVLIHKHPDIDNSVLPSLDYSLEVLFNQKKQTKVSSNMNYDEIREISVAEKSKFYKPNSQEYSHKENVTKAKEHIVSENQSKTNNVNSMKNSINSLIEVPSFEVSLERSENSTKSTEKSLPEYQTTELVNLNNDVSLVKNSTVNNLENTTMKLLNDQEYHRQTAVNTTDGISSIDNKASNKLSPNQSQKRSALNHYSFADENKSEIFKSKITKRRKKVKKDSKENHQKSEVPENNITKNEMQTEFNFVKPDLILKPGKWRRSVSIWRKSTAVPLDKNNSIVEIHDDTNYSKQLSVFTEENQQFIEDTTTSFRCPKETTYLQNARNRRTTLLDTKAFCRYSPEADARDNVLRCCGQTCPLNFEDIYSESILQHCRKIGEGVYGEVFMNKFANGQAVVFKIIPIEGAIEINGEPQKTFIEVLSEIIITLKLSSLRNGIDFATSGFVEVNKIRCVRGRYPGHLLELWELYKENFRTENDSPEIFPDDQLYIVLELVNAGQDLEAFQFTNAIQAHSALQQIALTLAVAEKKYQFEHRDLHWGNILLQSTNEKEINYKIDGRLITIPTGGVKATIIDYTLSRIVCESTAFYNDLSHDEDLFSATGDYQFEIYRIMRSHLANIWDVFQPYTNVVWLHYIIDKLIDGARYRCSKSRKHRQVIHELITIRDNLLDFTSASDVAMSI